MLTWSQTYLSIIDLVVSHLFVLGAYIPMMSGNKLPVKRGGRQNKRTANVMGTNVIIRRDMSPDAFDLKREMILQ